MINSLFFALFGWMPLPLIIVCCGAVMLFFLVAVLRLIAFILDLIPFL